MNKMGQLQETYIDNFNEQILELKKVRKKFRCPKCKVEGMFPINWEAFKDHKLRCQVCGYMGEYDEFKVKIEGKFNPSRRGEE